jgi:photosystem II stability/assembly factor-like uncharacterized protein
MLLLCRTAHSQWFWQNPELTGNQMNCVHFFDKDHGIVAGLYGEMLITTNGGDTFTLKSFPKDNYLRSIFFLDEHTGWITGDGILQKTTNGGISWEEKEINNSIHICLFFINQNTGWVCGKNGEILKSSNGGESWICQDSGHAGDLFDISFQNDSLGCAVGFNNSFLKTTDGGLHWNTVTTGGFYHFYSICFLSRDTLLAGHSAGLLISTDCGTTFNSVQSGKMFATLKFFSKKIGYAAANDGQHIGLYKTTDSGFNWTQANTPYYLYPQKSCILDSLNMFFLGSEMLIKTTDGGISWSKLFYRSAFSELNRSICFTDENNGYMVGDYESVVWRSTDGGSHWTSDSCIASGYFTKIRFFSKQTGVCVAPAGKIGRTTNAGLTWTDVSTQGHTYSSISCPDSLTGYIAGYLNSTAIIMKTMNAGASWHTVTYPYGANDKIYGIHFLNKDTGWVVCREGKISKTTDGGDTWTTSIPYSRLTLYGCSSIGKGDSVWAAGSFGSILFSSDGGSNWILQYSINDVNYINLSLQMFSDGTGYASGTHGFFIATTNFGNEWKRVNIRNGNGISDMYFLNKNIGWMAGASGFIMKTTTGGSTFVEENNFAPIPDNITLSQNYPNPFNPVTNINFSLPANGFVNLKVYNVLGKEIKTLIYENKSKGDYTVQFNAANLASGIYFYRLNVNYAGRADRQAVVKKMVLVK